MKHTTLFGRALLILLTLHWFWKVALATLPPGETPWIFLDFANLIFHEAGHVLFMFFGTFLHVLGGSLLQILIPAVVIVTFWRQGDRFAAGFGIFWLGQSTINLSYYIADARAQQLPLLAGDPSGHDWTWLLSKMNLLHADTLIGQVLAGIAFLIMLGGLCSMIYAAYTSFIIDEN
jgi:hypothetical protein